MASASEPALDEHLWTIAVAAHPARPALARAGPPNLAYEDFPRLLDAGIDDWGGVSPVTIDHVNPEAPWPEIERLAEATRAARARARAAAPGLPGIRRRSRPLGRSRGRATRPARADAMRARARRRVGARRAGMRPTRRAAGRPAARPRRATSSARTSSRGSSRLAGTRRSASSPRPTGFAARCAATR